MVHAAGQLDCMEMKVVPSDKVIANTRYHPKVYVTVIYKTSITCTDVTSEDCFAEGRGLMLGGNVKSYRVPV